MEDKNQKLGGNIELSGFKAIDVSSMIVLKKIVGNYAKKIEGLTKNMQTLHLTLKTVHEREKSEKYEIHAKVIDDGKVYPSEVTDRNLFVAVDDSLKKIVKELT
jgi:ribosome-associated translation inhibitor RaiA